MAPQSAPSDNGDLRRHILDTARHLLVKEGYQNLSMRKIADAIGYSATSIYLHFDSKDALLHSLIHEGMMRLHEELGRTASRFPDDPLRRLRALCRCFIDFGLDNPEYYEIMFQLRPERMERYPPEKYREARSNLDLFGRALKEGAQSGIFEVEDADVLASTIWASLHGTVSLLLADRVDARIDPETFIETAIRRTLRGCRQSTRSPSK
jgi:AcrR family transcriptional regulator